MSFDNIYAVKVHKIYEDISNRKHNVRNIECDSESSFCSVLNAHPNRELVQQERGLLMKEEQDILEAQAIWIALGIYFHQHKVNVIF